MQPLNTLYLSDRAIMAEPEKNESSRGQSLPWIVLSGIVGVFAVSAPNPNSGAAGGAKEAPKLVAKPEQPERGPRVPTTDPLLKPISDFHSNLPGDWAPADLAKEIHGYKTEFVIATVPDPIDSPFGYAFDQVVDAIQRGVQEKDGYVLDRAWLPWDVDRKAKPPEVGKEPPQLRETTPGVLLFRHGKDTNRGVKNASLCVVFLVGEAPVGGIHKLAFTRCLKLIAQSDTLADGPVRVIGPYFTGSQTSLQFVIEDWLRGSDSGSWWCPHKNARFQVIVGNASGMRTKDFFREKWSSERIEVSATVIPARIQLNAVLHFLAQRDGARSTDKISSKAADRLPGRVAILTESNTGFGKSVASVGNTDDIAVLRFPLHVSRLKSEYAQLFRKQDQQAGLPATATIAASGFEEAGGVAEGVPAQGGAATVAANNAVLENILSTISRERFRYVGVMATDTRDKLFLIRLIREFCPDVHVFVTQSDLLLAHPDYLYHMKGVIVGSTYPLYPPGQKWSNPNASERLLVSSSAAQSYYNATLATFGLHDKMLEYGPPGFAAGPDVPNDRPPVWVSMIAPSGAFVPLQLFTGYDDPNGYVLRKPSGGTAPEPNGLDYPGSLYLIGLGLTVFWMVLAFKCWRAQGVWGVGSAIAGPASALGVFRTVLLGAQLVFAVSLLALVSARVEHTGYRSLQDTAVLTTVALMWVAFVVTALRGVSFRRPAQGPASRSWRWDVLNIVVIVGLLAVTAVFLDRFWNVSDRSHRALFFVRAVDLASGLSPLTPLFLMCAAVTAGAYFQLERQDLARRSRVPSPFPSDAERVFDPLTDQDRRLKVEMTPGRFWKRHSLTLTGLFAGLAVAASTLWRHSLPTVEGNVWDLLFAVGFMGIYVFVALTIFQMVTLWRQTKGLLTTMAKMPLMRVFTRLPARVSSVVTRHLYSRSAQPFMLQITVHQLRQLADAAKADSTAPESMRELLAVAEQAEAKLQEFTNPTRGKAGDPADEVALRDMLSDATAKCLAALSPRWKSLPTDEAFGASPDASTTDPKWVTRAEELSATQLVNYMAQFFIQLRSLMLAVLVCSSLLLIAATSYPFHPERLLLIFMLGLVGAGLVCVVYVFTDMGRDEAIGRIAKSNGRFSLDAGFMGSFFTYVVPTMGILAAQLSGTFRWALEPILRVVK
ncbi:MAG: hypothetical protein C0467_11110 [Planctomycetaceae bacterium]|nr:hypothetical protein [Planctomycetaceae bacterium]